MELKPLNITAILSLSVLLSACGSTSGLVTPDLTPTPIEVRVVVPYECGIPPAIDPVRMRDVKFDPVEVDGIKYFALSTEQYQMLGLNTSDWIAASKQLRAQRDHYRDCIKRSQE